MVNAACSSQDKIDNGTSESQIAGSNGYSSYGYGGSLDVAQDRAPAR